MLSLFQLMFSNDFVPSWLGFLQALKMTLFKLTQRGYVNEYLLNLSDLLINVLLVLLQCFF